MKKNILIVDDSALMRRVLSDTVVSDSRYIVKDIAVNGEEGLKLLLANPDLYDAVLLDIYMPRMTGLELLEELEKHKEVRAKVIICSTKADESAEETMIALEHGAFDFIKKPENLIHAKSNIFKDSLLAVLEVATEEAKTIRKTAPVPPPPRYTQAPVRREVPVSKGSGDKIIALACSTGGPKTLQAVIPLLPEGLDAPMVLVQHMPAGFTNSLAMRLNDMSKVKVKEAVNGEPLQKGTVYIAPGGKHLKVNCQGGLPKAEITDDPPRDALRPCANIMYESLMNSKYDEVVCVVLTGMGSDGTEGIKALKDKKRVYVIAQDEATSVVYGMPKVVARAGLTNEILPVTEIADIITKKVGVQ
ncbi:MAG: chemotaxis-specific protein-glutamate methyltransferase CheB [Lachnospiraceae bacterium]|nr:chemotaxis-specific protein-glutamate methyltransferase CheB [Lachnospiraceae bacterium]